AHFLDIASRRLNCPQIVLTDGALEQLEAYDWPGNVRELHNVIERAVILSQRGPLRIDRVLRTRGSAGSAHRVRVVEAKEPSGPGRGMSRDDLAGNERDNIIAAWEQSHWRVSGPGGAAEILGVKPTTLASRLKRFGIERPANLPHR